MSSPKTRRRVVSEISKCSRITKQKNLNLISKLFFITLTFKILRIIASRCLTCKWPITVRVCLPLILNHLTTVSMSTCKTHPMRFSVSEIRKKTPTKPIKTPRRSTNFTSIPKIQTFLRIRSTVFMLYVRNSRNSLSESFRTPQRR